MVPGDFKMWSLYKQVAFTYRWSLEEVRLYTLSTVVYAAAMLAN